MMAEVGLVLVVAGWGCEAYSVWKRHTKIGFEFLTLYCMGVMLLVLDSFRTGVYSLAILNFLSLVAALYILLKLKK